MRGQMSVVFNTLGGDGTRRDGESNRYPVELPGGITRWNYPVELPGGITRWNYPVESGAFAAAFPERAETGSLAILGRTPRNSMPTAGGTNGMNAPHAHDCGYAFHLDTWANAAQPVGEHGIEMDPNTAEPDSGVLVVSAFINGNWNVLNVIGADDLCFALAAAGVIRRHTGRLP